MPKQGQRPRSQIGAWYGPIPMLRLIMALVDSDKIRHAYTKRNNISNERIVLDNQKSLEKRSRTVWEFVADKWNDIKFEPETEVLRSCILSLLAR
jgi:hypothetical protein